MPAVGLRADLPDGLQVTAYGRVALEGLAEDMLGAIEGMRNATLVRVAYRAGRLVAAGEIAQDVARCVLIAAARATGLGSVEAERTFCSGFAAGRELPAARASR
jgi:hypothetical protein